MPGMSSDDKNDWSSHVRTYFPNATELNEPSATNNYNCHGHAWHVSEGGDQVWIGLVNYDPNPYIMEDIYWKDGSYIRLNSESGADKISYYNGNHSAIQTSTTGTYHSKWGPGPVMEHAHNYGPPEYQMSYRYYYDEPEISGDYFLCYPSSKTYSVQDFYNVTYNWSTSSNLQINGSNTSGSVSISPKSSSNSSGYVRVSIYIPAYNKSRVITKDVWIGKPGIPTTNPIGYPTVQMSLGQLKTIYAANGPGATNYSWNATGSITRVSSPSGPQMTVEATSLGSGQFYCYGENICGTSSSSGGGAVYVSNGGGGGLLAIPNPAYTDIEIRLDEDTYKSLYTSEIDSEKLQEKLLRIINSNGIQVYSNNTFEKSIRLNVSHWKSGLYTAIFIYGTSTYKVNFVIN
jgi:hypothetical protein